MDIEALLHGLGLEQYAPAFRDNDIDAEVLPDVTAEDLIAIGVHSVGHRRKLLAAITALRDAPVPTVESPGEVATAAPQDSSGGFGSSAERRHLTVMFCDLVGSTPLSARLDPEDLREVIGAYHRCIADTVAQFDGFVAQYLGDGVLAYFGYPSAHEDDAERAVRAAVASIDTVGRLDVKSVKLQARVGIATGLVVVGDLIGEGSAQQRSVIGETPNLAARLQTMAEPDAVIIAPGTHRLVGNLFEYRDLGTVEVKGFSEPLHAYQVLRPSTMESRFEALRSDATPLVGRNEELDLLLRRWQQAKTGGGRVVLISGEPGIGKSRLTVALSEHIETEPHTRLRYFCSPHHQESALYPVIVQLERSAGFARDDDVETRRRKLAEMLAGGRMDAADLPLIADLLSLPGERAEPPLDLTPQQKKERTLDALLRGLAGLARQLPVLIVFEDLQWMDPTSRDLLDRSIARVGRLPVLLIATFRPEFQPPWVGQPHVTMLALSRLGRREGATLVRGLAADEAALPSDIVEEIVERTDGVPLFLEEVTKVVLEGKPPAVRGAVAAVPDARAAVPATLQASLMARLDRLGPVAREIAQTGAAIGREFPYELLVRVSPRTQAEARGALDQLAAAGLVFQHGTPPTAEYQFKHALVQDIAYGTLLRGPRRALHGRIASAMQQHSSEVVERRPETLAHHLTEAGDLDSAVAYWLEAGRRASSRSATIEAAAHLTRGIATLRGLTETTERVRQELAMQLALGPLLLSNRGYGAPSVREAYRRAGELAQRLDDDRARFAATWGMWITSHGLGDREHSDDCLRHLDQLIGIAERTGDPELSLQAHHSAWSTFIWHGQYVRSREHIRQGLAIYDSDKHRHHALMYGGHDPGVCGKGQGALALWALGYPDQAHQSSDESVALAEKRGHLPSFLHSLWFAGVLFLLRRDIAAARDCGARVLALGQEHGLAQYQAVGGTLHFWALAQLGGGEEAVAEMRSYLQRWRTAARRMLDVFGVGLAELELHFGNFEQAAVALTEAENAGTGWWRSKVLRVRGDLQRLRFGEGDRSPEQLYLEAISVAQNQQARSFELRSATALARFWAEQGREPEARDLLTPVYNWFSEGFDTPDLKEAKVLLEELG